MAGENKLNFKPDGRNLIHDRIEYVPGGGKATFDHTDVVLLLLDLAFPDAHCQARLLPKRGNGCFDSFEILQPLGATSKEIKEGLSLAALRIQSKAQLRRFRVPVRVSMIMNANSAYDGDSLVEEGELRLAPVKGAHFVPYDPK